SGELLGTRQSGEPQFRVADLAIHGTLLEAARDDAALILARDERLESDRGAALRVLLYLFERDAAVRLSGAGCTVGLLGGFLSRARLLASHKTARLGFGQHRDVTQLRV